jgi:hypothetical protein
LSYNTVNERIIYVIVVDGILARAYADINMAKEDYTKLVQFKQGSKISKPIAVKLYDNQAIDSKNQFNRVQFVG